MRPTAYHHQLVSVLQANEPELWKWFSDEARLRSSSEALKQDLLRSTYRITGTAHPEVLNAATQAAERLGLDLAIELYQTAGDTSPNAGLVFVPDAAIVLFSGQILELLNPRQLTAVLGHELAHHVLWSLDDSKFLVAERMLHALVDETNDPALVESVRRLRLSTELFADRGALLACGDLHSAVETLVTVATSMRSVNGAAFVAQAEEVLRTDDRVSDATTHPDTFLRALALQDAANGENALRADVHRALFGPIDIERIDLLSQATLRDLTASVVHQMIGPAWMRTDLVLAHASAFDVDTAPRLLPAAEAVFPRETLPPMSATTKRYLAYVLLDMATADPDLETAPLALALDIADRLGAGDEFDRIAGAELSLKAKDLEMARAAHSPSTGVAAASHDRGDR